MIENRLYIKKKKDGSDHRAFFFRTEKVVYIVAIMVALASYMISMGNAASFYDIAHKPGAAPIEAQITYKLLFFIKLTESVINLIFFMLDEIQSYTVCWRCNYVLSIVLWIPYAFVWQSRPKPTGSEALNFW